MDFEFDPGKSAANLDKHGIDFAAAQVLWESKIVQVPISTQNELRWLVIGTLGKKHWTAVITRRGDKIRLISVRRARDNETQIYENSQ